MQSIQAAVLKKDTQRFANKQSFFTCRVRIKQSKTLQCLQNELKTDYFIKLNIFLNVSCEQFQGA